LPVSIEKRDKGTEPLPILSAALQSAQALKDANWKAQVLTKIAGEYREAGQGDRALPILSDALQSAQAIEIDFFKASALREIADEYRKAGQEEQASEILSQAEELEPRRPTLQRSP
jgi:tetratricopeptide (TPR) repeat protein